LKYKQFFGAAVLLLATVGTVHAQTKDLSSSGVLLNRVAAVVNDGLVLRSDVERQMSVVSARIQQSGQQVPPRNVLRQQVLERLVLQELQMQRAERLGLKISDEMVNNALTDVAARNNIKFSDLPATLEAQGIDYRDYRDEVRREMTLQALRQRDVLARVYVSPREIEQCIAKRKASPDADNEFNLAHILVAIPGTADERQIAERTSRAQAVYERAKKSEDFAQLAITYSDSGTALEGGALGWRKSGQLPSFVADVIPSLKAGEVTEPIRTPSGLHIFKVLEIRGATQPALVSQVHARHILMKTNEVEDDETIRNLTRAVLTEFGYTVIEAADGEEAVRRFQEAADRIKLLLFDVIMPRKNGKAAYEEIREMRPGIKALFISGYSADIIAKEGVLDRGLDVVTKPVSPVELLRKVREVLDRKKG